MTASSACPSHIGGSCFNPVPFFVLKARLPGPGASNPFALQCDSLWPPDGATRAPKTCDSREGFSAALKTDPFYPRNCYITTSEADDSSFSKQTQGLGQECAQRPASDFPRTMDTWYFVFLFQKRKSTHKTKLIKRGCSIFSQMHQSALLPNKRGEGKEIRKDVCVCREKNTQVL